jgi:hypothetical protein
VWPTNQPPALVTISDLKTAQSQSPGAFRAATSVLPKSFIALMGCGETPFGGVREKILDFWVVSGVEEENLRRALQTNLEQGVPITRVVFKKLGRKTPAKRLAQIAKDLPDIGFPPVKKKLRS